jgi:hypothetical protein
MKKSKEQKAKASEYAKQSRKRFPTVRAKHRLIIRNFTENPSSMGAAIRKAGYSEHYAKKPGELINTKSFQQLLKEALPDDLLTSKHRELLNAEVKVYRKGELETQRMDTEAVARALDMGYKLKGAYAPERQIVLNLYAGRSDDDLKQEIIRLEEELGLHRDVDNKDDIDVINDD